MGDLDDQGDQNDQKSLKKLNNQKILLTPPHRVLCKIIRQYILYRNQSLALTDGSGMNSGDDNDIDMFTLAKKTQHEKSDKNNDKNDKNEDKNDKNEKNKIETSELTNFTTVLTPQQIIQLRGEVISLRNLNTTLYNNNSQLNIQIKQNENEIDNFQHEKTKFLSTVQDLAHQKVLLERTISNITGEQRKLVSQIREMVQLSSGWACSITNTNGRNNLNDINYDENKKPILQNNLSKSISTPIKSGDITPNGANCGNQNDTWFTFSIKLGNSRFSISINTKIITFLKQPSQAQIAY
jgi:hypothetical protein